MSIKKKLFMVSVIKCLSPFFYRPLDFCVCWRRFLLSAMMTENQSNNRLPIAESCCGLHSADFDGYSKLEGVKNNNEFKFRSKLNLSIF